MGFKIFAHSIRIVLSHIREALQISGLLYAMLVVLAGVAATLTSAPSPYSALAVFVWLAAFVVAIWIAVVWHRYILLDEMPNSVLPKFFGKRILVYVGYSALLWLIAAGIAVTGWLALTPVRVLRPDVIRLDPVMIGVVSVGVIALYVLLIAATFVVPYRLAPLLPGSAIGSGLSIRAAWAATRGATWSIIILAIVSAIAAVAIDLPVYVLERLPLGTALSLAWLVVTVWLKLMVGVTILTTIYGHYVEDRPIA